MGLVVVSTPCAQATEEAGTSLMEVAWINDFFFATDRYFTSGFELRYYAPAVSKLPTRFILWPHGKDERIWHGVTLTQHFFTPRSNSRGIDYDDRPFASYLLLGHRKFEYGILRNPLFEIIPQVEMCLGIPYTDIGAGCKFRAGKINDYFADIGIDQSKAWQLFF